MFLIRSDLISYHDINNTLTIIFKETILPNLLIDAGPGCGKTHTLADAYIYAKSANTSIFKSRFNATDEQIVIYDWVRRYFPQKCTTACYMAYNADIVADSKVKIHPDCEIKTIHGWGATVLKNSQGYLGKPIHDRGEKLVQEIEGKAFSELKDKFDWLSTIRFVDKLREELLPITEESMQYLQSKYADLAPFKIHPNIVAQSNKLITKMKTIDRKIGIGYLDQVWLACFLIKKPLYQFGFVDEAQDLSPLLLLLVSKLCENIVYCGDKNQAINAWKGADSEAMDKVAAECDEILTLKTSFRLPPNHARTANEIRPTAMIKSLPEKKDGIQATIDTEDIITWSNEVLTKKPMIVCRYNAPLVQLGLMYIKAGIPCKLLGQSELDNLVNTVNNRRATSIRDLHQKLDVYENMILNKGDDLAKEQNSRKMDAIRHILKSCQTVEEFEPLLKRLSNPPKTTDFITLSTVHKAKGREAKVIGILNPPIPSSKARSSSQKEQEANTDFVAHTRTMQDQYYIYTR